VAPSDSTVLIVGASGTGKELVAKLIHEKSLRCEKRFVVVNCGAIPETLLESELFGHVRGSYTGAVSDKKGLFEEADGGTIFLDEIGEIPLAMQVKLLRVLQDGEVRRVGGNDAFHVNVRVLSATNRDLYDMVRHKTFREDLFYRLNVITLHMPSLRERGQDIPLLAYYFLKKYSLKLGKKVEQISLDALQSLQEYQWPGNVRELENVIERALVLTEGAMVTSRELPPKILGEVFYQQEERDETIDISSLTYQQAKDKAIHLFNRSYLGQLLRMTDGNLSLASSRAGMDRSNFKKIIKKNRMNAGEFKKKRGQKYG
jgi:transcriptional regulator with PAS, ATPase and Fis domain